MVQPASSPCCPEPLALSPLVALLRQLFALVESLTDEQYCQKPVGVVESSIGGHVRHNLDHVRALLRGLKAGAVCYDLRERNTDVERDRMAALEAILQVEQELLAFPWWDSPDRVTLSALVAPDLPATTTSTSPERELAFVLSHTIHHNALIAVMVKLLGVSVPADFGYAPSTLARMNEGRQPAGSSPTSSHRSCPCAR